MISIHSIDANALIDLETDATNKNSQFLFTILFCTFHPYSQNVFVFLFFFSLRLKRNCYQKTKKKIYMKAIVL